VCQNGCKSLPALRTSTMMHGNDYALNTKLHHGVVTCALSYARMVPLLGLLGLRAPSTTDHYGFKEEFDPVASAMAEISMCEAHEEAIALGDEGLDYMTVDGGYTQPRNAAGCTMACHAPSTKIVEVVHKRTPLPSPTPTAVRHRPSPHTSPLLFAGLTDEGAKSSKGLEVICYKSLLGRPRVQPYRTVVMDGCRELVRPTLAAGKRAQGDLWHLGKNWKKWAELAIAGFCKRPQKSEQELAFDKLTPVKAVKVAPERKEAYGTKPSSVSALDFAQQRVTALGGTPPLEATAPQLKILYGQLATARAMSEQECEQERRHKAYLVEKETVLAAAKEREVQRGSSAAAQKEALSWLRDMRSMMRYVAEYTRSLRGCDNPASKAEWTDKERSAEYLRLWREGIQHLVLGKEDSATLKLLNHPVAFPPGTEGSTRQAKWVPPGKGYLSADSFAFSVVDSLAREPVWDDKFPSLIDGRMTFCNESFFHVLRKWVTKHSHFSRFYSLGIWCSLLDWNENASRAVLEHVWRQQKSGQLKSSAGRFYKVALRAPKTGFWRTDSWGAYVESRKVAPPSRVSPRKVPAQSETALKKTAARSYYLGWKGSSLPPEPAVAPTTATALAPAAAPAAAPKPAAASMKVPQLQAELAAYSLPTEGKKPALVMMVEAARKDPKAARHAAKPASAQRVLPGGMQIDKPRGWPRAVQIVLPTHGLPGPYRMPADQLQTRKSLGPQWTKKRTIGAMLEIARGQVPKAIKRKRPAQGTERGSAQQGEETDDEEVEIEQAEIERLEGAPSGEDDNDDDDDDDEPMQLDEVVEDSD
jgi:hypothetical protein